MPKRIISGSQLPLFPEAFFYVSQKDAAKHLNINTRTINYWESQGLLHPELYKHTAGKGRKYTPNDMVELGFIKGMVIDHGYSIPELKEKLKKLQSPYYYDPTELFWDIKDRQWKNRESIASGVIKKQEKKIRELFASLYDKFHISSEQKTKEEFIQSLLENLKTFIGKA